MADETPDDRAERVHASFDDLHRQVEGRLDAASRDAIEKVRTAAAQGDRESTRAHMESLRERHGWLYEELAAHPRVATLLDELALWGF